MIDFNSLWLKAAKEVARLFLQVNGLTDTKELQQVILEAMGVINDTIDAKAPLAYQTYPEIAKSICDALQKEAVESMLTIDTTAPSSILTIPFFLRPYSTIPANPTPDVSHNASCRK